VLALYSSCQVISLQLIPQAFPLAIPLVRHRFLWRLRAPSASGEVRRVERWLASARVFLAVSALVAVWLDPGEIRNSPWATGLLAFYIAQAMVILLLLRRRQESTPAFRVLVHAADVVWPALILAFALGQANPFFLFFVFVLAAAAYRWGLWETVGTGALAIILLWIEGLMLGLGLVPWLNHIFLRVHLPLLRVDISDFEPRRLFLRSSYLIVMSLLLGYLAEQQKQLRAEKAVITRILGSVRVEMGLTGTLQHILSQIAVMYAASKAVIASQDPASNHLFVAELSASPSNSALRWMEASTSDQETYLFESPADTYYALCGSGGMFDSAKAIGLDDNGDRLRSLPQGLLDRLKLRYHFQSVAMVSFVFGSQWWGRIFLLDAQIRGDTEEELRFLQELVRQVGPAVYNVYLLRRLRQRAGAVERARFARELHDGAVQSLIAVEMQVDVLRRQPAEKVGSLPGELERIQSLLREEVLKLRELMQQMKSLDVDARRLLGFLHDTVERFQRETGISARFHSDVGEVDMPQHVCREVARIVQEGLVNVRKHSRAQQVFVRLGAKNGSWYVTIEDDGQGFPFSGRLSDTELEKVGKAPAVITERVRLIDGELTVESNPGRGSRLEVRLPQRREATRG
jgi:signal transduction histidine kinase